ncbi:MAG TPA: class I SAM-dependent methyltransferase [Polyangiales bacterium]
MSDQVLFPERFKQPARYYTTGRPTYPKLLTRRVADLVGLTGKHDVLDLGTGPGFLAIDYAPLARAVTAIEPSEEMLSAARRNAERGAASINFLKGSSFELGSRLRDQLARFLLVTIGRAFHWMDREQTLAALDPLVERVGGVALFGESYPEVPDNAWYPHFQALLDSYASGDPAKARTRGLARSEGVLLRSSFDHLERVGVLERRETPIERLVDRALSFGAAWDGRPGNREDDLATEVRKLIARYATEQGTIHEVIEGHALVALRSAELGVEVRA